MMKLECTTTGFIRPRILEQTYSSFSKSLVDVCLKTDGHLYINFDRRPLYSQTLAFNLITESIDIAKKYFNSVTYRIGEEPSHSIAASWTLSQPKGDFFFNIEDDWRFTGELSIEKCINAMKEKTQWRRGKVLQCVVGRSATQTRQYCHFPPSLFNTKCIQGILQKHPIPKEHNPELWLVNLKKQRKVFYQVAHACQRPELWCQDIGRNWKRSLGKHQIKFS